MTLKHLAPATARDESNLGYEEAAGALTPDNTREEWVAVALKAPTIEEAVAIMSTGWLFAERRGIYE